jgi:hypothetical protein
MTMKAFISHSSIDKPFVERLATDLRTREGIDAWLDKWEILPGDRIPEKLEEGLSSAGIFVLVLSPESINSQWVSYERDAWLTAQVNEEKRAREESRTPNRRLIPIFYKDCKKPFFLESFLHVSINGENYEEGFQQLVRGMRGESGKPPLKGEATPAPVSVPTSMAGQSSPGVVERKLAFNRLKILPKPRFEEVVSTYGVDTADLPTDGEQVEKAIKVIEYAVQNEKGSLSNLLNTIYKVENVTIIQGDKNEGDKIDAQRSKGFINKSTGSVTQNFGNQRTISTGGGDYAGRDINKQTYDYASADNSGSAVTLQSLYDRIRQKVEEAKRHGNDDLADDLQEVEQVLQAAVKAENESKKDRRQQKLNKAKENMQNLVRSYPALQKLASSLQQLL